MKIATATAATDQLGPLTQIALQWARGIEERATGQGVTQADWEELSDCIAVNEFKRVGAYLEELNWPEYLKFMTEWAGGGTRFETTVFQEIEERHFRGNEFIRKNVIAVYRFNQDNKICHLDIYEQAQDSGDWIKEAARSAVSES